VWYASIYPRLKSRNFTILAFPCNQFLHQEPGNNTQIKQFIAKYNLSNPNPPFFSKVNVTDQTNDPLIFGGVVAPIYRYILSCFPGYITWNFEAKFIVDMNGIPLRRFSPGQNFTQDEEFIVQMLDARDKLIAEGKWLY